MPEYAKVCMNVPISAQMAFVLFTHSNPLSTWMYSNLFQCLYKTRSYSLMKYEAVFLRRQNFIFPIVAGSIWFVFLF